jgi:hypothetical protein
MTSDCREVESGCDNINAERIVDVETDKMTPRSVEVL